MFDRPLKKLTVCIENEYREDVVIIFAQPSFKELEKLINDGFVFGLVADLLWINKEKVDEEGEGHEKSVEESIEENEEDRKKKIYDRGRRKGEELWLEMWGREIEHRFITKKKEMKTEDTGEEANDGNHIKLYNLLAQSMDGSDTNNQFDLEFPIKEEASSFLSDYIEDRTSDNYKSSSNEIKQEDKFSMDEENQEEKKMFPCNICGNLLSTLKSLKRHKKIHTRGIEKSEYDLNVTDLTDDKTSSNFIDIKSDNIEMKRQIKNLKPVENKDGRKMYPCYICKKLLTRKKSLKKHIKIHTGGIEKPVKCDLCGKGCFGKSDLNVHRRTHTGEKPYVCDVCGVACISSSHLSRHKKVHTGVKPFTCEICNKAFADSSSCKRHLMVHTGEKPYSCELCGKVFTSSQTLKEHNRSHTGEKLSYPCDICGKLFTLKRNLTKHKKLHSKVKNENNETMVLQD